MDYTEFEKKWKPVTNYHSENLDKKFFPKSIDEMDFVKDHIGDGVIWSAVKTKREGLILVNKYEFGAKFYFVSENPYRIGDYLEYEIEPDLPELTVNDISTLRLILAKMYNVEGSTSYTETLDKVISYLSILHNKQKI